MRDREAGGGRLAAWRLGWARRIAGPGPLLALCLLLAMPARAVAGEVLVAVASNFAEAAEPLRRAFEAQTGHRTVLSTGSTGKLYAQIRHGAPYDVLLAADRERPSRLEAEGHAVDGSRFTYAFGRLVLWSAEPGRVGADGRETLRAGRFRRLAIANPDLAPYGAAAWQVLRSLDLLETLRDRLVLGENVGQAHALVATGNAELGLVARSSLTRPGREASGSRWDVPAALHAPIRQEAVLLAHGKTNPAARAFLEWLRSPAARASIRDFGYGAGAAEASD